MLNQRVCSRCCSRIEEIRLRALNLSEIPMQFNVFRDFLKPILPRHLHPFLSLCVSVGGEQTLTGYRS